MEWDELQRNLEKKLEAHLQRTRPFDVFYALCCAAVFGLSIGMALGFDCTETFLGECVNEHLEDPVMFAVGFVGAGIPAYWASYQSIRGYRRRKRWFG